MKIRPAHLFGILALLLGTLSFSAAAEAQPVRVDKVEPANWWAGMAWNRVQLMVYGENLRGVTARFEQESEKGPHVAAVHAVPNASYAFVDIVIPEGTAPDTYALTLRRGGEEATVAYPILEREGSDGRYQGFGPEDVVYLITPDRFANADTTNDRAPGTLDEYDPSQAGMRHGGDLEGIIQQLDYLQDLGVTALWLNPVLENRGVDSYHGYKTTDFYRIDPRLGTNDDYRRLVDEAHRRGMKVIFDHVNNHIGIRHPWIGNLPRASWLNGSVEDHLSDRHYKMSITDPHADPATEEQLRTFWFVDTMPDLNQRDPLLANYLIQNTLWWIETTGLDGIREDTYPYPDQEYMARWAEAIMTEYPAFNIVGEIWEGEPAYLAMFQKESRLPRDFETNLPAVMDFAFTDAVRQYLSGDGTLRGVYQVIAQDYLYTDTENLVTFVDNHDMERALFVADGDAQKTKQALTLLLTMRGIPQLLYGTEIGMVGGESHPELRADMPGGFPGDARSVFTEAGRTAEEDAMFGFTQALLRLRQEHPALAGGRLVHYAPTYGNDVYAYFRLTEEETILVAVNGHDDERTVALSELARHLPETPAFTDLMTGEEVTPSNGRLRVEGHGALVLRVDE